MEVQARRDNSTVPFIRSGVSVFKDDGVIKQDAGRAAVLAPLTLLGKSQVVATSSDADGGNVGNGTVTLFALAPGGPPAEGSWNLECITAVGEGGIFKLEDPSSNIVANDITMTPGAGGTTDIIIAGMSFRITDGGTDFNVGDKFALLITADGDFVPLAVGDVNGGGRVAGVYLSGEIAAADIVAADVVDLPILIGGSLTFDASQLVIEGGADLDTVLASGLTIREEMAVLGMFAEDTVDVDSYET